MKKSITLVACILITLSVEAQVSDLILKGLIDKSIIIEKMDGTSIACKLLSFDDKDIAVADASGIISSISRSNLKEVRIDGKAVAKIPEQVLDKPIAPQYFMVDPLGFIQLGPYIEYGFSIGPTLTIGAGLRIDGLGLLYRALANTDGSTSVSIACISGSVTSSQFFRSIGMNRWYITEAIEYGRGSSTSTYYIGDYTSYWALLKAYLGFGYRWRNPSKFFLDLGVLAGVAITMDNYYIYDSSPNSKHYTDTLSFGAGMIQLHLGWELGNE
jgi:hypothetical protein